MRPGNTAPFEEKSQRWRAVGNTVSDLTGPRFEPQTSRSRDERVTVRPTLLKLEFSHVAFLEHRVETKPGEWECLYIDSIDIS